MISACAISAYLVGNGINRNRSILKNSFAHLACEETLIDKFIKLVLPCIKIWLYHFGSQSDVGRAYGFMSILGIISSLKNVRFLRDVFFTVFL